MGLHNKYPSYFYKRGNLFNTYLGHTDGPGASTTSNRQKKQTRSRSSAGDPATGGASPEPFDHALATELHAFTLKHLSDSEASLLVERVCRKSGSPPLTSRHGPRNAMRVLIFGYLTQQQQRLYLAELRRRLAAEEPLVR